MHKERPRYASDEHHLVSLDPRDLEDLRRLMAKLDPASRRGLTALAPVRADNDGDPLLQRARTILDNRRKRSAIFGPQMFSEPAWEMLLTLYADQAGQRHSQASLSRVPGGSRSTGMRWIDYLLHQGLISSEDHPTDRRRKFIALTEKGRSLLDVYLSETGYC
jgi:DNA-binding MarR family transcriptional regulator